MKSFLPLLKTLDIHTFFGQRKCLVLVDFITMKEKNGVSQYDHYSTRQLRWDYDPIPITVCNPDQVFCFDRYLYVIVERKLIGNRSEFDWIDFVFHLVVNPCFYYIFGKHFTF